MHTILRFLITDRNHEAHKPDDSFLAMFPVLN